MTPGNDAADQQETAARRAVSSVEGGAPTAEGTSTDQEELRREIADAREDLGDTVEALADKADVKAQAKAKVEETKQRAGAVPGEAKTKLGEAAQHARQRPAPVGAVAAALAGALVLLWLIRRR